MMFDAVTYFMTHGSNGQKPWMKQEKIKMMNNISDDEIKNWVESL